VKDKIIIDTNLLMQYGDDVLKANSNKKIYISMVSLDELDNLKNKSGSKGFLARQGIRAFKKHQDNIEIDLQLTNEEAVKAGVVDNTKHQNDNIILSTAVRHNATLLTNDISLEIKAKSIGVNARPFHGEKKFYNTNGWKYVVLEDSEVGNFYSSYEENCYFNYFDLGVNEYAIILNKNKEPADCYKWTGEKTIRVNPNRLIKSEMMGKTKPKDYKQVAALDSLENDQLTMITGPAGTGKSLLSLNYCFQEIEANRRLRVNIFINPVQAKGTVDLGAYPGDRNEKLLSKNLGSMLAGKLSSKSVVEKLITEGMVRIYPISEIRGLEIKDNEILYIPEAQNTTSEMIKLAVQRASSKAKVIVEGDINQSDSNIFSSGTNGLKRLTEVFHNKEMASRVNLTEVYRSEIAKIAQSL